MLQHDHSFLVCDIAVFVLKRETINSNQPINHSFLVVIYSACCIAAFELVKCCTARIMPVYGSLLYTFHMSQFTLEVAGITLWFSFTPIFMTSFPFLSHPIPITRLVSNFHFFPTSSFSFPFLLATKIMYIPCVQFVRTTNMQLCCICDYCDRLITETQGNKIKLQKNAHYLLMNWQLVTLTYNGCS